MREKRRLFKESGPLWVEVCRLLDKTGLVVERRLPCLLLLIPEPVNKAFDSIQFGHLGVLEGVCC